MAHQRFRKFSTQKWYSTQQLNAEFCMAVRAGKHIFLRGQTGWDLDGRFVGKGDPGAQADQALKNAKVLLEEAGSKLEHICKITVYLLDRAHREPVYQTIGRHLQGVYPVSTGLIVAGLALPEMLVEIDIDAVIPDGEATRSD